MSIPCLLLIDDDEVDRKIVCRVLAQARFECEIFHAVNAAEAHQTLSQHKIDCILLDYHLPDIDGLTLLTQLLDKPEIYAPIIMLTGEGNEMVAVEAMKRGAFDYMPKNLLAPDGLVRVISQARDKYQLKRQLAEAQAQLAHQAKYDDLTQLGNRNLFLDDLRLTVASCERREESFYLLMVDLDRFKAVNDTYGHDAGNAVLMEVGRRLASLGRTGDTFYRLGGDEFTAIVEAPNQETVLQIAQRIVSSIALPIFDKEHRLSVGASIGIAHYPQHGNTPDRLLKSADTAMYQAKRTESGIAVADHVHTS
jgi:diguanylate cyclase (GGDEF)-like protein